MIKAQFGMIGLGTMGRNLVLNIAGHGFAVCGYDRDVAQQERLITEGKDKPVYVAASLQELVNSLEKPARIMLLVPAGKIVDNVLAELVLLLQKDDIVIEIAGKKVANTDEVREKLHDNTEKSAYNIKATRNGNAMSFDIKIAKKLKTANL